MKMIKCYDFILFFSLAILLYSFNNKSIEEKRCLQWEMVEWSIENPSYEGNPFDVIANVSFTHQSTGKVITTQMFYDGNHTWKFRFTGSKPGEWFFVSNSNDPELDAHQGIITVEPAAGQSKNGFMTGFGNKWGWQGTGEVFIPQYVMGKDLDYFYDFDSESVNTDKIKEDIKEFIYEHGFTGFHLKAGKEWFVLDGKAKVENPDPRTYRVLEAIIAKVHESGGACHIWMWESDGPRDKTNGKGPRGILGAAGNEKDLRNLRYLAARLGPLPGWSLGYGIDTENGVATIKQLNNWKSYLEQHMGWDHFIGARVGFDEKGLWALTPKGTRPPHDEKFRSEISDEHCFWLGGDYIGYTSYRPMYDRYRKAIQHQPDRPSFEEDRFRLRNSPKWTYKDYYNELTRRGLWNSAMAGGAANIWGNLLPNGNHGGSQPYNVDTINIKHQIKTYAMFFANRFKKDMQAISDYEVKYLSTPDNSQTLVYKENTSVIEIKLPFAPDPGKLRAVAVDAKKSYQEMDLGDIDAKDFTWDAPYISDWAIAIGQFK